MVVSVMQAAESRVRNNTTPSCRADSATRCFLIQSEVGAVLVIIADVLGKKSLQVVLVQSDNVVEHIPAAASDPALGNPVGLSRQLHRMETMKHDVSE
jgi:hypothetical protein